MPTQPTGWRSYDSVVDLYEQVAVPWFTPLAADLVAALRPRRGERVLDLGAGTGLVGGLVAPTVGVGGVVVGLDPSIGMLRVARARPSVLAVAGTAPGLPFGAGCFDVAAANLVLSHLPDLAGGLADLARALRPGARLGMTTWGPDAADADDRGAVADAIVAGVRESCGLPSEAPGPGARWEQRLRDGEEVRRALGAAGLHDVRLELHRYRHRFGVEEYASGWGGLARYLRSVAGEERWRAFSRLAVAALRERLGDGVVTVRAAWVATGVTG
jgi:SAM-dependent methyltransferase